MFLLVNLLLTPFSFPLCIQDLVCDFSLRVEKNCLLVQLCRVFEILFTPRGSIQREIQFLNIFTSYFYMTLVSGTRIAKELLMLKPKKKKECLHPSSEDEEVD